MHLSLSGGGARAMVFASFFQELDSTYRGRLLLQNASSLSGVSAGALVATPLAMGVAPKRIFDMMAEGGLSDWLHWPRAVFTALGFTTGMYDGSILYNRLDSVCKGKRALKPVSIGVTSANLQQKSLRFSAKNNTPSILNCAVASASVPGVFRARDVSPVGKVFDGGAAKCTFPVNAILTAMRANQEVVLFNSAPWPGFRQVSTGTRNRKLFENAFDVFNEHGLEWIPRELGPGFQYKDGIFRYKKITFIAPTGSQYEKSDGNRGAGNLFYTKNSSFVKRLQEEGREIARSYVTKCKMGVI